MGEPRRNIELKARDPAPARSAAVCEGLGAEAHGVLTQRDTYFNTTKGRLKLREERGTAPQLIAYARAERHGSRESRYRLVEVKQAEELIAALSETLGVKAVVAKQRRLFLWQGVRLHLDQVEGLGSFLEFEAVAAPGSDLSAETRRVQSLHEAFQIRDADLLAGSYCDLILASP